MSRKTYTKILFIAALFTIAKKQEKNQMSINRKMNKQIVVKQYSATKQNKLLIHTTTWIHIQNHYTKEKKPVKKKRTYSMISCIKSSGSLLTYRNRNQNSGCLRRGEGRTDWRGIRELLGVLKYSISWIEGRYMDLHVKIHQLYT